ncbi:MAG: VanZ family protein [Paludibacteraceae bacterium]|nr:VanZ family protein [Paludibacteraceae bacterium]
MTKKHSQRPAVRRGLPSIIVAAMIAVVCLVDLHGAEQQLPTFEGMDKLVHALMFAVLTLALAFDLRQTRWRRSAPGLLIPPAVYGALIEVLQATLTDVRSGDWLDWIADIAGALTAFGALLLYDRFRKHHPESDRRPYE